MRFQGCKNLQTTCDFLHNGDSVYCRMRRSSHIRPIFPVTKFTPGSSIPSYAHASPSVCQPTLPRCRSDWPRLDTPHTWWGSGTWASAGRPVSPPLAASRAFWERWPAAGITSPTRAATTAKLADLTCTTVSGLPGRWLETTPPRST